MEQKYIDRFWKKVDKHSNPNGCWEWTGFIDREGLGYGRAYDGNKQMGAHRLSIIIDGRDPTDKYVCHSCDNPKCVNPSHLFLGTQQDNLDDMKSKGRKNGRKKINLTTKIIKGKGKPIQTPLGHFASLTSAATAFGISPSSLFQRMKTTPTEYYYT